MSLTYTEITRNALLKIGVLDEEQAPSAVQVQDGTRLLNEMLEEWDAAGSIKLGFYPQTGAHDTVAIPDWAKRAITFDLGVQMASEYSVELSSAFTANQESAHSRLLARSIGETVTTFADAPMGYTKRSVGGNKGAY